MQESADKGKSGLLTSIDVAAVSVISSCPTTLTIQWACSIHQCFNAESLDGVYFGGRWKVGVIIRLSLPAILVSRQRRSVDPPLPLPLRWAV